MSAAVSIVMLTAVATLAMFTAGSARIAHACSCVASAGLQHRLGGAEVAFVGTPLDVQRVSRTEGIGEGAFELESDRYTFRVDEVVKGDLPAFVEVDVDGVGTSCETGPLTLNQRLGVIPNGTRERYSIGFCDDGAVDADELLDLKGRSMPAPDGEGPIAGLLLAPAGPAQVLVVDDQARVLGYVVGLRGPQNVAACPGGATAVVVETEFIDERVTTRLATVDLASLRITGRVDIPVPAGEYFYAQRVLCTSADGRAALFVNGEGSGRSSYIVAVSDGEASFQSVGGAVDVIADEDGMLFAIADDEVVTISAEGDVEVLAELPDGSSGLVIGYADGTVLVAISEPTVEGFQALTGVASVATGDGTVSFTAFESDEVLTPSEWVDAVLIAHDNLDGSSVRFDTRLTELDRSQGGPSQASVGSAVITWGWEGGVTVTVDGRSTDSLSAIGIPLAVRRVQPTTTVLPDSPGARALPYTATAEEILGENSESSESAPSSENEPGAPPEASDPSRLPWVLAGAVAAAAALAAIAVAWRLRRRAGAAQEG